MLKTAIITGIAGQDGAYLADFLLKKKYRIIGVGRSLKKSDLKGLEYFGIKKRLNLIKGDITSAVLIKKLLLKYRPQEFYNLAGQSSVAKSWADPDGTFKVNSWAVFQMLRLICQYSPRTRFFECSSAEIFGNAKGVKTENNFCFKPLNPYGVSKLAAHRGVQNFRVQFGLFACNGILFNHESPLKADFAVSKKIAKGVAAVSLGLVDKITLGNINVRRDWGFAGDFVKAMWMILQQKNLKIL